MCESVCVCVCDRVCVCVSVLLITCTVFVQDLRVIYLYLVKIVLKILAVISDYFHCSCSVC